MALAWICIVVGILVCTWGFGAVLSRVVRNWSTRSITFLALVDVLIGALLIFVGVTLI